MRGLRVSIRRIGNSHGIVIPKPILRQVGLEHAEAAEITVREGALVLRPARSVRAGWAEAAQRIAEAGDDRLLMGEFGNAEDAEFDW